MTPLTIWAVSDGRVGIEAQALGLAEAVARLRPARVVVKRIRWKGVSGRLPWRLIPSAALDPGSEIAPPWPDIWIATGRATLPLSTRMRRRSGGRTLVVQTQDPRTSLKPFDLVVPPEHDGLAGANVFPILGAPNRLTPERLQADLASFASVVGAPPHPRLAVIVGGKSSAFALPPDHAERLARSIARTVEAHGGSVLVSFTQRTPAAARAAMEPIFRSLPGFVWDGGGENPYFALLALADVILVTEDSTNLAMDAAATGKPVVILDLPGRSPKLARFHAELARRGIARRFEEGLGGALEGRGYPPLLETDRAAAEVLRIFDAREAIHGKA